MTYTETSTSCCLMKFSEISGVYHWPVDFFFGILQDIFWTRWHTTVIFFFFNLWGSFLHASLQSGRSGGVLCLPFRFSTFLLFEILFQLPDDITTSPGRSPSSSANEKRYIPTGIQQPHIGSFLSFRFWQNCRKRLLASFKRFLLHFSAQVQDF